MKRTKEPYVIMLVSSECGGHVIAHDKKAFKNIHTVEQFIPEMLRIVDELLDDECYDSLTFINGLGVTVVAKPGSTNGIMGAIRDTWVFPMTILCCDEMHNCIIRMTALYENERRSR